MRTKFVVRLLGPDDGLLAWAEVWAEPQPQREGASCPFFPKECTKFAIETAGEAARLTIHWCDLDVARSTPIAPMRVEPGQVFDFTWMEPVWLVPGMRDVPLPAVTVRAPVAITVPTGAMAALSGQ